MQAKNFAILHYITLRVVCGDNTLAAMINICLCQPIGSQPCFREMAEISQYKDAKVT